MVCTSKQEYRCYGSCGLLYLMADILSEQVSFHAVQQKGEGDDCRERIKGGITCQLFISDHSPAHISSRCRLEDFCITCSLPLSFFHVTPKNLASSPSVMAISPPPLRITCILPLQSRRLRSMPVFGLFVVFMPFPPSYMLICSRVHFPPVLCFSFPLRKVWR